MGVIDSLQNLSSSVDIRLTTEVLGKALWQIFRLGLVDDFPFDQQMDNRDIHT